MDRVTLRARVPVALRSRLIFALAAAEEKVRGAEAAAARDIVSVIGAELPLERSLAIALRLVGVAPRDRRAVLVRTLALLHGHDRPDLWLAPEADGEGMIRRVARRFGGRRAAELRRRTGDAALAARAALRLAYLSGAADVRAVLRDAVPGAEAVQIYLEHLRIGPGWAECVFHDALAEMAA
jgi:hypothetical protein